MLLYKKKHSSLWWMIYDSIHDRRCTKFDKLKEVIRESKKILEVEGDQIRRKMINDYLHKIYEDG